MPAESPDLEQLLALRFDAVPCCRLTLAQLERTSAAARAHPRVPSRTPRQLPGLVDRMLRAEWVEFVANPIPGLEGSEIAEWIVTSVGRSYDRCLDQFVLAMRVLGANPLELLSGRRPHGQLADGRYFAMAAMIPGSRVQVPDPAA